MERLKTYGIILASGYGSRYGNDKPKQFIKIAGKTILEHTLEIFEKADAIDNIIVVITPEYRTLAEELAADGIRVNVINPERCATPMRFKAFGKEPDGSLLEPEKVAEASLKTFLSDLTGQVIDVKRN